MVKKILQLFKILYDSFGIEVCVADFIIYSNFWSI